MPGHGLTPILLCLLPMWRILTPVFSHPQHSRCLLVRFLSFTKWKKNWISYIRSIMCTYLCIISCFLCVFSSFLSYYYFHSSLFFIPSPAISSSLKGLECISLTLCDVRSVNVRNKGPLNLLHLEMNRVRSQERRWTHTVCLIKAVYLQQLI